MGGKRVDTRAADEYSRPEDTYTSWTNGPERLRVARPAAATAGFFVFTSPETLPWLHWYRRRLPRECFGNRQK
jgi:hypothetical protein